MRVLGVDPGAKGALAIVDGHSVDIFDMPRLKVSRGASDKDEVDGDALWALLSDQSCDVVYFEKVGGMEGQSASAAFNFGRAVGAAEYLCVARGLRRVFVAPGRWKKGLRIGSGKDDARAAAMRLWPAMAAEFRKRRPDFAEAALIAESGRLQEGVTDVFD